jgi:hypothetical protein
VTDTVSGGLTVTLAEKFKTTKPSQSGLPCGIAKLIDSLSKEDKETLEEVLFSEPVGTKRMSNTKIHQILTDEGYSVAVSSIAQHRRKQCRCFVGVQNNVKSV